MKPGSPSPSIRGRDLWLAVTAAFLWGATFPVTAAALAETPPIFFTFLRFVCAAVFVIVIPRPQVPLGALVAIGLFFGLGQYGLMFVSMTRGIPAGLASLLIHMQAFFTILIAMILFGERLTRRQGVGIGLALAGLLLLVSVMAGETGPQGGALIGLGLILVAALSGAGGNIVLKSLGNADMLGVAVWMSVVAPIPLLILSVFLEGNGSPADLFGTITWTVVLAAVYSAGLATVFAYAVWGRLFATYSAAAVAPFFLLVPVFGLGLSTLLLGERLSLLQICGAGLIFAGLALTVLPRRAVTEEGG
ncbi:MAG: EamA family transporter [Pseudomonadota bacterium]